MEKNELAIYILDKLIAQGGPSFDRTADKCKFRLGDRKCSAGHLIPDELYEPVLENIGFFGRVLLIIESKGYNTSDVKTLVRLHDQTASRYVDCGEYLDQRCVEMFITMKDIFENHTWAESIEILKESHGYSL